MMCENCTMCIHFVELENPEPWAYGICGLYDKTLSETQVGEWCIYYVGRSRKA